MWLNEETVWSSVGDCLPARSACGAVRDRRLLERFVFVSHVEGANLSNRVVSSVL